MSGIREIIVGVATAALCAVGASAWLALQSEAPPWAASRTVQSMFLTMHIKDSMRDYCTAEADHNALASRAANEDIMEYELRYGALNPGQQVALRPCP